MAANMSSIVPLEPPTPGLTLYEHARTALAECVRVDEAKDIRDKAAAMKAYARQRDDKEMGVLVSEIYLRACQRIGQLSSELETAELAGRGTVSLPSGGKTKAAALAEAGISTSTAHRYEELAGSRDEQAAAVGVAAAESYFAQARAEEEPATMQGLRTAVRSALRETFGEPAPKPKPPEPVQFEIAGPDPVYLRWAMATKELASMEFEPARLAARAIMFPQLVDLDRERCVQAAVRINRFLVALDKEIANEPQTASG